MSWPQYLVDWWSLVHAGVFFAVLFGDVRNARLRLGDVLVATLVLTVAWEAFEATAVEPLFGFQEPWYNRWLSDPVANLTGALLAWWALRPAAR